MKIIVNTDATQRQLIHDFATIVYAAMGYRLPSGANANDYFWQSSRGREIAARQAAESIFEILTGDTPDYSDDPDDYVEPEAEALSTAKLARANTTQPWPQFVNFSGNGRMANDALHLAKQAKT